MLMMIMSLMIMRMMMMVLAYMMIIQVEILSTRLHSSINLVGLALGNPLLSPKIQFKFSEMAQVENYENEWSIGLLLRNRIHFSLRVLATWDRMNLRR